MILSFLFLSFGGKSETPPDHPARPCIDRSFVIEPGLQFPDRQPGHACSPAATATTAATT
jgi:hypothetical protein